MLSKRRRVERQIAKIVLRFVKSWMEGNRTQQHMYTIELFHVAKQHPDYGKEENERDKVK